MTFIKEGISGVSKFFVVFLFASILFGGLGGITKYLGMWGDVTMERIIVKNSFQYKEGMRQQAAIWEASIASLEAQLMVAQDDEVIRGIQGQLLLVKSRLRAVTINQ